MTRPKLKLDSVRSIVLALLSIAVGGCILIPDATAPIGRTPSALVEGSEKPLVVMLPGIGDRMEDFVRAGFVDLESTDAYDVIAVDGHFGYYRERNLVPRLREDIIVPAQAAGYRKIWLLGISMGGFGALLYAAAYPDDIAGLILLSPYLGDRDLVREIENQGGLRDWREPESDSTEFRQHDLDLWRWLKAATTKENGTPIILGYGRGERMAYAYGPLLQALNSSVVFTQKGGHKWSTWKSLWKRISTEFLAR